MDFKERWAKFKSRYMLYNFTLVVAVVICAMIVAHIALTIYTRHSATREVPNMAGVAFAEAQKVASDADVELVVNDSIYMPSQMGGIIVEQLPAPGATVKPGRVVYVTVTSYGKKKVRIPYVAGLSLRQAKNKLEVAGLGVEQLIYQHDLATNYVLEERYHGELIYGHSTKEAPMGSGVVLYVGTNGTDGTVAIPKLKGMQLNSAKSLMWEMGLNVGKVHFDNDINLLNEKDARVYMQSPAADQKVVLGQPVDIYLTLDDKKVAKGGVPDKGRALVSGPEQPEPEPDSTAVVEPQSPDSQIDNNEDENFF